MEFSNTNVAPVAAPQQARRNHTKNRRGGRNKTKNQRVLAGIEASNQAELPKVRPSYD